MRLRPLLTTCAVLTTFTARADVAPPKPVAKPTPAPAPAPAPAKEFFTVGLVASLNDDKAAAQADSLAGFLGGTVGKTTRSRIFHDYDELAAALGSGSVDFALMGPLAFLRVDPKKSALLFRTVRKGKATYRAVLFAKPGSALKSLDAVRKGKSLKVGWVDASSATGYLIPKALLLQNGINPVEVFEVQDFVGSHDAVCTGVAEGKWDVGATFTDDPAPAAPKVTGCQAVLGQKKADALTIVAVSGEIPNDVLVASAAVPKALTDKVVAATKALAGSDAGKKTLSNALLAEGVADVTSADFEPVRKALDAFHKPF